MSVDVNGPDSPSLSSIGRRGLIVGAGAAALVAGASVMPQPASAKPVGHRLDDVSPHGASVNGSPVTDTLSSSPINGYVYRYVAQYDFFPFSASSQRTWGGSGVYTAGSPSALRASVDIPPGSILREVEYYVYNNSGGTATIDTLLTVPQQGSVFSLAASASVPSTNSITANRVFLGANNYGPHPISSKLLVSISTGTSGTIQVNGARLGFTQGAAATGLLSSPVRAYDSRNSGGKLAGGGVRTITLPASIVPKGTAGVLANITAVNGEGNGYLKVYAGNAAQPAASAINFLSNGTAIANAISVAVSTSRQIKIYASHDVHVIVDVTGTLA